MQTPIFVRELTAEERQALEKALRGLDVFALKRAQIVLLSARGQSAKPIAQTVGCCVQTARNAIHAFNTVGLDCLQEPVHGPQKPMGLLDADQRQRLKALLHQSPRTFDKPQSTWTLELLAIVAHEQGITTHCVSDETIRRAIGALGVRWKRAKQWLTSPDPAYARKKSAENA